MEQNPYEPSLADDPPGQPSNRLPRRHHGVSNWWLVVCFSLPILIMLPFLFEEGWYGRGPYLPLQAFLLFGGTGAAYYVVFQGKSWQRWAILPLVLLGTGVILLMILG